MIRKTSDEQHTVDRQRFPTDPWRLVEAEFSAEDLGVTETLFSVGNGYLGMRGNVEEGRESHSQGTFVNGFHETWPIRHAEDAYGFAKVGQTIVNVPDAKVIRLYVDDEPLLLPVADLLEYERSLDLRDGVLRREVLWRTPSGKRVRVSSQRMVSFTERHLAVMTFEVTLLDDAAPVAISSQVLNRQDGQDEYHVRSASLGEGFDPRKAERFHERVLQPQTRWGDDERVVLSYRCTNSGMTLAVAADDRLETDNAWDVRTQVEEDLAKHVFRVQAQPGRPIRLTKTVAYHTSRGVPSRELVDRCRRTLDRVTTDGVEARLAEQREWLDDFWARSDVEVGGRPEIQQAIRWNLFQLAQATARAEGNGVPAKGLTGSGYGGHYFWDTEIYVLPFLTYTSPRFARNALRFRYHMLGAARRRAAELSQRGALFPWRTINGEEASAYYAAGTAQYHIDADVSYALVQYVRATDDVDFMRREAVDILVETARMWEDLGFWRVNSDDNFHIHGVTGPDEYTTVVNDNLFTNVMARFNLRAAALVVERMREEYPDDYARMVERLQLSPAEVTEWSRAAEKMAIPYEEVFGIHPQDSHFFEREIWDLAHTPADKRPLLLHYHPLVIYRYQVLKQADVVLALFLQGHYFTPEEKLADFEYYDPLTTGDSTLSGVVQSIIAAEVGYHELALEYFLSSLYVDLANLHANASDGVHVASAGGTWSALACGFGGMRDHDGELSFDPRLPQGWESLTFRVAWRGTRLRVTVLPAAIELTAETGDGATVGVRGQEVTVDAGQTVVVPLDGHGPVRPGRPGLRALSGNRRDDGTLITATVPHS
ncbi:alpha,alpha-trehalose phosphorylase [Isoptericola jiangsuensis]|uniref:Alpha,alpha-trehalose phosphorylase n=1 Tax=Isoptericola jiangsuensis TaxID=548579 RepID=A0A2A9F012_9MICO|nr:glycosyl hydrolase family 65 protein [Isoptericola jiangsuensis]PFG43892.1 alpha,alpha-trehalose phosphorylase [Isoptericola jiangsuensis]